MRIIGGKYKGRIVKPGKNFRARPTTDLAREGLFNILTNRIDFEELEILDLFSGTGSISFEFASRGCKNITLVENDPMHLKFIVKAIKELDISGIEPIKADVFRFIKKTGQKFDLIFADPPYELKELQNIPSHVFDSEILKPGGQLILEHPKSYSFSNHRNFTELRRYGSVHFSFFKGE